jgi:hypothetical protein
VTNIPYLFAALFYTSFEYLYDHQLEVDRYVGNHPAVNPVLAAASTGAFYTITRAPNTIALAAVLGGVGMGLKVFGDDYFGLSQKGVKSGIFF